MEKFKKGAILFFILIVLFISCDEGGVTGKAAQAAMGYYAEGYNELLNDFPDLIDSYYEELCDDDTDLSRVSLDSTTWAKSSVETAKESFRTAKNKSPSEMKSIGEISDRVIASAEQFLVVYEEVYNYFDRDDFEDDNGEKLKELNPQLIKYAEEWDAAWGELDAALTEVEDQQLEIELKEYEGQNNYSYWFRKYNSEAKIFLAEAREGEESFPAAAAEFEKTYNDLTAFTSGKESKLNDAFSGYKNLADMFYNNAKRLERYYNESLSDEYYDELDSLIDSYNSLIETGNVLYHLESYDQLN